MDPNALIPDRRLSIYFVFSIGGIYIRLSLSRLRLSRITVYLVAYRFTLSSALVAYTFDSRYLDFGYLE